MVSVHALQHGPPCLFFGYGSRVLLVRALRSSAQRGLPPRLPVALWGVFLGSWSCRHGALAGMVLLQPRCCACVFACCSLANTCLPAANGTGSLRMFPNLDCIAALAPGAHVLHSLALHAPRVPKHAHVPPPTTTTTSSTCRAAKLWSTHHRPQGMTCVRRAVQQLSANNYVACMWPWGTLARKLGMEWCLRAPPVWSFMHVA